MKKIIIISFWVLSALDLPAQNLVTNPGAESLPRGTGWTIISQGTYPCLPVPTNTFLNWTLIPDGTINYPFDHTTGAAGGTIFYSGCSDFFSGIKELQQTIDVTADAAAIDAGTQLYTFSGYMQTPVDNQTDRGRFIVDYLDASNILLGSSYTSAWQSYFDGSGTSWTFYTNTRTAPVTTRKIRIRLQAELINNRYAINVYFDDISLTKPSLVPVRLISFTGKEESGKIILNWKTESELNFLQYELEKSTDGINFPVLTAIPGGQTSYTYTDQMNSSSAERYFYRLRMTDKDGKISYSNILGIQGKDQQWITISPNPASDAINISGLKQRGSISIINSTGAIVLVKQINTSSEIIGISALPAGLYVVQYRDEKNVQVRKLIIQYK
jgi:hypothetical protein